MRAARGGAHGTICQEGRAIRIACAVVVGALLIVGCGAPRKEKPPKDKPAAKAQEESDEPSQVNTQAAEMTYRPPNGNGKPLWTVSWDEAQLRMDENQKLGGTFTKPKGTLFGQKGESSNFTAFSGEASQSSGELTLTGSVTVNSLEQKSTLRCDEVRYASKGERIVRAHGHVSVNGPWGTVSGLEDVLTTPDLKTFATPDLFPKS